MRCVTLAVGLFALCGALVVTSWPGKPPAAEAQEKDKPAAVRWEYRHVDVSDRLSPKDVDATLNKLGEDGWEVVTVYKAGAEPADARYVLKRPKK